MKTFIYYRPIAGLVPAAWNYHTAPDIDVSAEELASLGYTVAQGFADEDEAEAWIDDRRLRCSVCGDGHGRHVCGECQATRLEAQLRASVRS